jgi:hypothetical protein
MGGVREWRIGITGTTHGDRLGWKKILLSEVVEDSERSAHAEIDVIR